MARKRLLAFFFDAGFIKNVLDLLRKEREQKITKRT